MTKFKVGDRVMFKDDIEQYGTITKFYATAADVNVWNGDTGQYDRWHVPLYKLLLDN